jgi:hypothetical protein
MFKEQTDFISMHDFEVPQFLLRIASPKLSYVDTRSAIAVILCAPTQQIASRVSHGFSGRKAAHPSSTGPLTPMSWAGQRQSSNRKPCRNGWLPANK